MILGVGSAELYLRQLDHFVGLMRHACVCVCVCVCVPFSVYFKRLNYENGLAGIMVS
jgi:hypothetical protein